MHHVNRKILVLITITAIFILLGYCKKDETASVPVIHATLSPKAGNTTQTFVFDLSQSESRTGRGTKVFTRWDWDGDGKWDTPFTRLLVYEHRYYVPGTWNACLEMSNLDGSTDTMSFSIPVARGYSPPKPVLSVVPEKGHIFTRFALDATRTHDDEDSLKQLSFRWDFEGDGQWDTGFGDSVKIFHIFPEPGYYEARVQVRDPSGLISAGKSQILVNMEDPMLKPSFVSIPDSITNNTPVVMDASSSSDLNNPDKPLMYRWDWNNDHVWDTEWLSNPQTEHIFEEEFFHFVRLEVRSQRGLMNDTVMRMRVYHRNIDPRASFTASTTTGNLNTLFRFDCWSTRDLESSVSELLYRWDFDGDGQWDTDFEHSVVTMHQYDIPGTYKTMVLVQDPHGGQDTCSEIMHISNGTNITGIYEDTRGYIYQSYGTVLIGDQWWMTRNMCTQDTAELLKYPYSNGWPDYFNYGHLYYFSALGGLCPPGWRAPTKADWDQLFSNYPEDRLYEALMPGGESDFGADLGGTGLGIPIREAKFQGLNRYGYYWSTTKPMDPSSQSIWVITFDGIKKQVLKGYYSSNETMLSVRCMKNK